MSERKLEKYLEKYVPFVESTTVGERRYKPILFSDSKGRYLRRQTVSRKIEEEILWWCTKGMSSTAALKWARENKDRIRSLRPLHLYVWFGTCDLTAKTDSGAIALKSYNNEAVYETITNYRALIEELVGPNCFITFIEIPIYSVLIWNQRRGIRGGNPNDDVVLKNQVHELNLQIRNLNYELTQHSPSLGKDLYTNGKYRGITIPKYNFKLYTDGIHPIPLLTKVWLTKLIVLILFDCY